MRKLYLRENAPFRPFPGSTPLRLRIQVQFIRSTDGKCFTRYLYDGKFNVGALRAGLRASRKINPAYLRETVWVYGRGNQGVYWGNFHTGTATPGFWEHFFNPVQRPRLNNRLDIMFPDPNNIVPVKVGKAFGYYTASPDERAMMGHNSPETIQKFCVQRRRATMLGVVL